MKEENRLKLGLHQANCYFRFLVKECLDDVIQEVKMAVFQSEGAELRLFNNQVNRNLYSLAKSRGFRKVAAFTPRMDTDKGKGAAWERKEVVFCDCKPEELLNL